MDHLSQTASPRPAERGKTKQEEDKKPGQSTAAAGSLKVKPLERFVRKDKYHQRLFSRSQ